MSENVDVVRSVYEAFARGDISAVLAVMDENLEWHEAEHIPYWPGGPYVGPQAVVDGVIARIPGDYDGFRIDVRRIVGCGETVLAEARYRGTVRATGKALDAQVEHERKWWAGSRGQRNRSAGRAVAVDRDRRRARPSRSALSGACGGGIPSHMGGAFAVESGGSALGVSAELNRRQK